MSLNVLANTALTNLYCYSNKLTSLDVSANTTLIELYCYSNQLTNLNVSTNTALTELYCYSNQLTNLNISTNTALILLNCRNNQLTSLDVSTNTVLTELYCNLNSLSSLDIHLNTALTILWCDDNMLTSLNAKNGNNINFTYPYGNIDNSRRVLVSFDISGNPGLTCIEVDDANYSTNNWTDRDSATMYSEDCSTAGNEEFERTEIFISPNPTDGFLNITVAEKTSYKLLNIRGQVLIE